MHGGFGRRQGEYQPATPGVHRGKLEGIAQERTVSIGVGAVEEHMGADDHGPGSTATAVP
jgi:hypothetical protein